MSFDKAKSWSAGSVRSLPASSSRSPASSATDRRVASGGSRCNPSSSRQCSTGDLSRNGEKRVNSSGSTGSKSSSAGKSGRPSDVLNPKTTDPEEYEKLVKLCGLFQKDFKFAKSGSDSSFSSAYKSGAVPCRLAHGSVRHKLSWSINPQDVVFDPTLILLAEGIRETVHPYTFVARTGFKELLECSNATEKTLPLVPKLVQALRQALSHKDGCVFEAGLDGLCQLSSATGVHLNPHLKTLLQPVSKRTLDRKYKDKIIDTLHILEQNGGKESFQTIKSKVPTYSSIFT